MRTDLLPQVCVIDFKSIVFSLSPFIAYQADKVKFNNHSLCFFAHTRLRFILVALRCLLEFLEVVSINEVKLSIALKSYCHN